VIRVPLATINPYPPGVACYWRAARGYVRFRTTRLLRLWLASARYRHHLRGLAGETVPNDRKQRLHQMALLAFRLSALEARDPHTEAWWLASVMLEAIAGTENGYVLADGQYTDDGPEARDDESDPHVGCVTALLSEAWHGHWVAMAQPGNWSGEGRAERAALLREMSTAFAGVAGIEVLEQVAATEMAAA
jgi:hypothetical protein